MSRQAEFSQTSSPPDEATSITVEPPIPDTEVPANGGGSQICQTCKRIKSVVYTDVFFFVFGALIFIPGVMLIVTFSIFGDNKNFIYGPILTVVGAVLGIKGCAMRISMYHRKKYPPGQPRRITQRENTAQRLARFELSAIASSNNMAPPQYHEVITPSSRKTETPVYFSTTSSPCPPRKPTLIRTTTASQINMAGNVSEPLEVTTRSCNPCRWHCSSDDEDGEENLPPNHISVGVDTSDLIIDIPHNNSDVPPDYNSIYKNTHL